MHRLALLLAQAACQARCTVHVRNLTGLALVEEEHPHVPGRALGTRHTTSGGPLARSFCLP